MTNKINTRFIIQIAGKPVENVEKALNVVVSKLKESKKFKVLETEISEPQLDEQSTLYSGFIDILIQFKETAQILEFIVDYTPNSIEIEEPEDMNIDNRELTGILNDMSNYLLGAQTQLRKLNAHAHMQNKKIKELEEKLSN